MANYVDGFIVPVPKKNVKAYVKIAKACAKIWVEYGALEYFECRADDVKHGKITSFAKSVKLKSTEVVFFSWITYKSRAQRDRINAKIMNDPRILKMDPMKVFDWRRMIYGGFKPAVKQQKKKR
jgi:uncharacterized protein YbaA (DUF1428 family)